MNVKTIIDQIRKDWLLYIVFFFASLASVMYELYAILFWMVITKEISRSLDCMLKLAPFIAYIVLSTIVGLAITGFPADKAIIQIGQLVVYMSIYYAFMLHYRNDLFYVFEVYMKFAYILALAGIIQYLGGRFLNLRLFYFFDSLREHAIIGDYTIRAKAWVGEPANFAEYLIPALAYNSIKKGLFHNKTILLIIAGFLSATPIFKLTLLIIICYSFFTTKQKTINLIVILIAFFVSSYLIEQLNFDTSESDNKTNELFMYWGQDFNKLESANLSTYAFLKNLRIAMLADNRLTGTGIGTHGYSHDAIYRSLFIFHDLSKWDAYSLGVRIFSELGIVGLIVFFWFIVKNFNKHNLINISILFYLFFAFLRGGHYTISGLQFFVMMYLFNSKDKSEISPDNKFYIE